MESRKEIVSVFSSSLLPDQRSQCRNQHRGPSSARRTTEIKNDWSNVAPTTAPVDLCLTEQPLRLPAVKHPVAAVGFHTRPKCLQRNSHVVARWLSTPASSATKDAGQSINQQFSEWAGKIRGPKLNRPAATHALPPHKQTRQPPANRASQVHSLRSPQLQPQHQVGNGKAAPPPSWPSATGRRTTSVSSKTGPIHKALAQTVTAKRTVVESASTN